MEACTYPTPEPLDELELEELELEELELDAELEEELELLELEEPEHKLNTPPSPY